MGDFLFSVKTGLASSSSDELEDSLYASRLIGSSVLVGPAELLTPLCFYLDHTRDDRLGF